MKKYEATKPFTRQGRTVKPGEPLLLSDKEALYLQLQGNVKPVEKREGRRLPAPKKAGKKTEGKTASRLDESKGKEKDK